MRVKARMKIRSKVSRGRANHGSKPAYRRRAKPLKTGTKK